MIFKNSIKLRLNKIKDLIFEITFRVFNYLYRLKKIYRRTLLFLLDSILIFLSIKFVNYLYFPFSNDHHPLYLNNWIIPLLIFIIFIVYNLTGQYISLSRYIKSSEIYSIAFRNFILVVVFLLITVFFNSIQFKIKQFILLWIISTFITIVFRFSIKEINIFFNYFKSKKVNRVAIYGAGGAGAQLAASLILEGKYKIIAFFDDSYNLRGRKLQGITIYSPDDICMFKSQIDQILLAIPSISGECSKNILNKIQAYDIPVMKVPSIEALTSGSAKIDSLRPIEVEDLLGRGSVRPFKNLVEESINNLNICITGAGGSIGRELCSQVLKNSPNSLVMIDNSESSLYHLEQEILKSQVDKKKFRLVLGNVENFLFLKKIFKEEKIDIVFHAAAYKHVPLIELNPLQGINNNVFSTYSVCKAAEKSNVKKITLISTDKAVRPSNVMGASKRLAELIFQAYADKFNKKTFIKKSNSKYPKFSIVRFGNVLNSSGSVVPLFKKQISKGGPITLTHKNVIRYFMTVPEAAQLVIQATTLSKGGEVFLLDMGDPVRIYDLALQMIKLSGLTLKDLNNVSGDIEIITTGLRPGEKLYEELLIKAESKPTIHPLIFKANEDFISYEKLEIELELLKEMIEKQDISLVFKTLSKLVPEWSIYVDS